MPPPGNQQPSARYENPPGNGTYQTLASTSTPAAAPRISSSGNTGNENAYHSGGNAYNSAGGGQTAPPGSAGFPRPNAESSPASTSQKFDTSRRPTGYNRQSEELHMPQDYASMGQLSSREHSGSNSYNSYNPAQDPPRGAQQGQQYSNASTALPLPGALQPGNTGRPQPSSVNTAPSTVPILPPIATQSQAYPNSSRPSAASHSHSYSRSSPAASYVNPPDDSKYASPPSNKYTSSQAMSYSPLGLADIRPRADSGPSDVPASANPYSNDGSSSIPTNCNYLAPWAVYAFDWCKWPVQQQGLGDAAGKMAIGSYLEDGHNFVRYIAMDQSGTIKRGRLTTELDTNTRYPDRP